MTNLKQLLIILAAVMVPASVLFAHHNTNSEFGWFDRPTMSVTGKVVKVTWGNPHVALSIESTGGDVSAGGKWHLVSHPLNIMGEYGLLRTDFAVGDTVTALGWQHQKGQPLIWLRAIQINDGPMRSAMRYTDMRDIARGELAAKKIVPPADLNGSDPLRAGEKVVAKLQEMGLLDDEGMVIWPPQ